MAEHVPAPLLAHRYVGEVVAFDDAMGIGTVEFDRATGSSDRATIGFHCTQISDGSRTIAVGTKVRFTVIAVNLGKFEAANLEPR